MLTTPHLWGSNDGNVGQTTWGKMCIDVRHIHPETGLGGLTSGTSIRCYPSPLRDPSLLGRRPDVAPHPSPRIHDNIFDGPSSLGRINGLPVTAGESNILFVDGLPTDCSRREVGHLFRPFIGFRELRVVHKEPKHSGDQARVLCFVEFADAKCALMAMKTLQELESGP